MVVKSGLWFEAIDWEEAGLYVVLTSDTSGLSSDCLPQRKYSAGAAPSITTAEVLGPIERKKDKSKFYSPVREPSNEEKLEILRLMIKTGIQTAMTKHTYRWNNLVRLQNGGGSIGDKLAQASARLFMIWWDGQFLRILKSSQLVVTLYKRYVDDANCKVVAVPPGTSWDNVHGSEYQS